MSGLKIKNQNIFLNYPSLHSRFYTSGVLKFDLIFLRFKTERNSTLFPLYHCLSIVLDVKFCRCSIITSSHYASQCHGQNGKNIKATIFQLSVRQTREEL